MIVFVPETLEKNVVGKAENTIYDNVKFVENGIKLSKWVENTVGKREIAQYEHFLLFPQSFQKTCTAEK